MFFEVTILVVIFVVGLVAGRIKLQLLKLVISTIVLVIIIGGIS